jgi:hypothetical protein
MRAAAAPVAVYEMLVHEISSDVLVVVMKLFAVQTGTCLVTVMVPSPRSGQPLTTTVAPPVAAPSLNDPAVVGVDDDSVRIQLATFCAVAVVVVQPALLVQAEKLRVDKATESSLSLTVAVALTVHVTARPLTENVPPAPLSLVAVTAQLAPLTHVRLANAGVAASDKAPIATTSASKLPRAMSFMVIELPFSDGMGRRLICRRRASCST